MLFFLFLVFLGIFIFLFYNVHYLILLLGLELILLSVVFFLYWGFLTEGSLTGLFSFFLLMVCMGGFSISLLVSLFRELGQDFWGSFRFF